MIKFTNTKTEITEKDENGKESFLGYANLAKYCIDNPPKDGWDKDSMKVCIKVEDKLEKLEIGKSVQFEDAEFEYLYNACQPESFRWAMKHKDIVKFIEYLDKIKE